MVEIIRTLDVNKRMKEILKWLSTDDQHEINLRTEWSRQRPQLKDCENLEELTSILTSYDAIGVTWGTNEKNSHYITSTYCCEDFYDELLDFYKHIIRDHLKEILQDVYDEEYLIGDKRIGTFRKHLKANAYFELKPKEGENILIDLQTIGLYVKIYDSVSTETAVNNMRTAPLIILMSKLWSLTQ